MKAGNLERISGKPQIGYSPEVVKAVLFDVAGVLTESYGHIILEAAVELDADIELLADVLIPIFLGDEDTDQVGHRLERGEVTLEDFLQSLGPVENDARSLLHPDSPHFFGHSFNPNQEMMEFAKGLSAGSVATGIVSNSVKEWMPAWETAIPDRSIFDTVILSSEVGLRKPSEAMYALALEQLGISPHEAVFLDDFEPMVEGAKKAGLHAIHVADHGTAIQEVRELLKS
tara:strand:+ start:446 stop:1135 length:690 start_codon:yes stop_codon:yes gene_type:complete